MIYDLGKLDLNTTAVLVIDMQKDFLEPGRPFYAPMGHEMMNRLAGFIQKCRAKGLKIIYTRHEYRRDGSDMGLYRHLCSEYENLSASIAGTEGAEICDEVAPEDGDYIVVKHCFNAFQGTDLDILLRSMGIRTLILTGVNTDQCCFSIARGAIDLGYDIVFVSDLTATKDLPDLGFGAVSAQEVHRVFLAEVAASTGRVASLDELSQIL